MTVVCLELITEDELKRSFRTFTPEPREPSIDATLSVVKGELRVETADPDLERYLREVLDAAADDRGRLQARGYHTSTKVRGSVRMNKHYPGDFVPIDDPRYLEGVARALCYVGENDPSRRYHGKILHAFVESGE